MEFSPEQQKVMDAVLAGKSIFYTGPAGTGKSFMLQQIVDALRAKGKVVFLTAPTGI